MKRYGIILAVTILLATATGCLGAAKGEGLTLDGRGLTVGPSQEIRDKIANDAADAEIANDAAETAAEIEQQAKDGQTRREAMKQIALAVAVAAAVAGVGFGLKLAAPLAREAVGGLEAALALRQSKRLEISLEVGPQGYSGHLLAEGYTQAEITDLVHQTPVLDAPRVQQLQIQAGPRGMQILAERGEIEETLERLTSSEAGARDAVAANVAE